MLDANGNVPKDVKINFAAMKKKVEAQIKEGVTVSQLSRFIMKTAMIQVNESIKALETDE